MAGDYAIFRQRLAPDMMNNPSIMEIVAAGPFDTAKEAAEWIVENHTVNETLN